jgi:hypothetical protein
MRVVTQKSDDGLPPSNAGEPDGIRTEELETSLTAHTTRQNAVASLAKICAAHRW